MRFCTHHLLTPASAFSATRECARYARIIFFLASEREKSYLRGRDVITDKVQSVIAGWHSSYGECGSVNCRITCRQKNARADAHCTREARSSRCTCSGGLAIESRSTRKVDTLGNRPTPIRSGIASEIVEIAGHRRLLLFCVHSCVWFLVIRVVSSAAVLSVHGSRAEFSLMRDKRRIGESN